MQMTYFFVSSSLILFLKVLMNDTSFISSNSHPLVSRCNGAECRSIPVACECVSVFEESWNGREGGVGRGRAERRRESGVSGVSSGGDRDVR